jgi:sugar/nucleoside kinase (ribokinase family)
MTTGPTIYVIGNVNVDLIMGPVTPWPKAGTESILPHSELRVGGAVGNAGLALQAMGARYRLIGNRGDDVFGRWLAEAFGDAAEDWPVAPTPTTVSVCLGHPNGERTFLTSQGHLSVMSAAEAIARLPVHAGPGDVALLCGGFVCPRLIEGYGALLSALRERGFAVALDTGWPSDGWNDKERRRVAGWLSSCDHVLLNEIESCGLSGKTDVADAARWIAERAKHGAVVAVKRGPLGASLRLAGKLVNIPAPPVSVVDTVGAGDVFNAAYLQARLMGQPPKAAVAAGVALASAVIATSPRHYAAVVAPGRRAGSKA